MIEFERCVDEETGEYEVVMLPSKWGVCEDCGGEGKYPDRSLSPYGDGSYTQSEFSEACYDDPDFCEEYFGGAHDVSCETCRGRTTVLQVDWQALEHDDPKLAKEYEEHLRWESDYAAECAHERKMGY